MKEAIINLYSGGKIDLLNPKPEDIRIEDIAKGLGYKAHFSGLTPFYFSIASHSLLVCDLVPREYHTNAKLMMYILLHDASEAYIGDMVKPLKDHMPEFRKVEKRMQAVVYEAFGIKEDYHTFMKEYDIRAFYLELEQFYKDESHELDKYAGTPDQDVSRFLERYYQYQEEIKQQLILELKE